MKKFLIVAMVLSLFVCYGQAQSVTNIGDNGKLVVPCQVQGQQARVPGSLTTTYAANNAFAGNTFDITPNADLTLTDMDIHWDSAGELLDVEVYYKVGTAFGFETNAAAWTLLQSATGVVAGGAGVPTNIGGIVGSPTFLAGQTYGIAVGCANYASLFGSWAYTNGQYTYSHPAVTLLTQHGLSSPLFSGAFYPRAWNGTIYFDHLPVPVLCDIKVNGEDSGVSIYSTDNVVIDIEVLAGADAGLNSDVWVLVRNQNGKRWSYNLAAGRWYRGWCFEYVSGPLGDHDDNVLDMTLPPGQYDAYIGIDDDMNGMLNIGSLICYDHCDFEVITYVPPLWDNGWQDDVVAIWINHSNPAGTHQKALDDFVVAPTETWTLTGLTQYGVYPSGGPGAVGWELDILTDATGAPGTIIHTATSVAVTESDTGMLLFGAYPIYAADVTYDPIVLAEGTYWIRESSDNPVYSYYACTRTAAAGIQGSEGWFEDNGGFGTYYGPVSGNWTYGPFDWSFLIWGTK